MQELRFANDGLRWQLQRAQRQLSASEERNQLLSTQLYTLIEGTGRGGEQSNSSPVKAHTHLPDKQPNINSSTTNSSNTTINNNTTNFTTTNTNNNSRGTSDAQYKRTIARLEDENKRLTTDNDQLRLELATIPLTPTPPLSLPPPEPSPTSTIKRRSVNFSTNINSTR